MIIEHHRDDTQPFHQRGRLAPRRIHAEEADAFATGVDDYTYWNLGVAVSVKKYTFDFRYWDTSIPGDALANEYFEFTDGTEYGLANERFVFTASVTLP